MNEEFTHVGSVRRRPRGGNHQQRSQGNNGKGSGNASANGSHGPHSAHGAPNSQGDRRGAEERRKDFEREAHYDRSQDADARRNSGAREQERRFDRENRESREAEKKSQKPQSKYGSELDEEPLFKVPFDPWRLFGAAKRNILWILSAGAVVGLVGFLLAALMVQYKVPVQLIRKTSNAVRSDNMMALDFMPREYSEQTLFSFMTAYKVRERVAEKAAENPALASLEVTPQKLGESLSVRPTPNPDMVIMTMEAFGDLRPMVDLANLYAKELVDYLREVQRTEAGTISKYLQGQIAIAATNYKQLTAELGKFSDTGWLPLDKETQTAISLLTQWKAQVDTLRLQRDEVEERLKVMGGGVTGGMTRLDVARQQLKEMQLTMTDKHSLVLNKKAEIERLEKMPDGGGPAVSITPGNANDSLLAQRLELQGRKPAIEKNLSHLTNQIAELQQRLGSQGDSRIQFEIKQGELKSQEKLIAELTERQRQAQGFYDNSLGYFNVHSEASLGSINKKARWMKVSVLGLFAAGLGALAALAVVLLTEMMDTTLRTPEDITRVTNLPVLATLGDLRTMSPQQQVNWAFRTLTLLRGKLSRDPDQALVCGIISANRGEGRSTWVNLLVSAANQRGLRVLTVDTRSNAAAAESASNKKESPTPAEATTATASATASSAAKANETANGHGPSINLPDHMDTDDTISSNVLSTPAKVAEQLQSPNSQPLVHIPLPGWVWSLERRKQWERALEYWKDIDNLVIFVELPPASEQESVLLSEHLPQCIWLTGSGMADSAETAAHIETLRHARCNLVGAVLNYAPPPFLSGKITRWFNKSVTALLLGLSLNTGFAAEEQNPPGAQTQLAVAQPQQEQQERLTFGASKRKRGAWQERLTFGSGDAIDIHFYGNPALSRTNVLVGPDGRINYLQATGVTAAGTTVEELRQKLDTLLVEYYPGVKTIVVPVAYNSKRYFMLGKVNAKGAYLLDRPVTLLEAVARAKGLETGLYQRTTVEMADLGRSFVVRGNERLPVDFEKLFQEGDLTQNIVIEPNDYIFFASTGANDIYVLGEVMNPGPLGFVQSATVIRAIADRGGYSEKAFKKRVLVIRGSLDEPETFIVDSLDSLEAAAKDFRLQPRDIVYVSRRPWIKAEELLDEAASSFIQGAVTTWAGLGMGPVITSRWFPRSN